MFDQQAVRYIQARLTAHSAIHNMGDVLSLAELKYTGTDSTRYLDCIEYYIRTAILLGCSRSSLQDVLRSEIESAHALASWSVNDDQKQKHTDRLNIATEFQRHVMPIDTKDHIKRVGSKLYAPEGRIYKMDLLVGAYMTGRKEAQQALEQGKELLAMVTSLSIRESAMFYINVMNEIEEKGLTVVFELQERGQDILEIETDHKTEEKETSQEKNQEKNVQKKSGFSMHSSRQEIVKTFSSVPQWSQYKDTVLLLDRLNRDRYEPAPWSQLWWKRLSSSDPLFMSLLIGSGSILFFGAKWSLMLLDSRRWTREKATRASAFVLCTIICAALTWKYRNFI